MYLSGRGGEPEHLDTPDLPVQGSLKDNLKKTFQLISGGLSDNKTITTLNNQNLDDDPSSIGCNNAKLLGGDGDTAVNNMFHEASSYNCRDIQAASFNSELDIPVLPNSAAFEEKPKTGGGLFGTDNKLEESSLIYGASNSSLA